MFCMKKCEDRNGKSGGAATKLALAMALVAAWHIPSALAQDASPETRIRRLETEIRALQRKVFPGGDGRFFTAETQQSTVPAAPAGPPSTTAVTDLLTRMESLEGQLARLTAQNEENTNRLNQLEARLAAAAPAPAPAAPAAPDSNLSAMTAGAATPRPAQASVPTVVTPAPLPRPAVSAAPRPSSSATAKPVPVSAAPSAQRLAAVRAIVKPQSDDPGEDEYSYGFRLWEAKFYPEAQQQIKMMVERYPRHARISFARNLLGRSFLDDNKPRDAASWFLQNYQANKTGERAPDSLLLLAEAMRRLNDTSRACIALAEFADGFRNEASGRLRAQYEFTRGAVKCN